MTTHRPVRTAAALATVLLAGALASAGPASAQALPGTTASGSTDGAVQARAVSYHPTVAIGSGKRKVRFLTCKSGSEGNYTVRYKATTRRSSDRSAPRIKYSITDGSGGSEAEFSLFPGDLTQASTDGLWSSAAEMRVTLRLLGKVKKKQLTVGQMGAC